ncbi:neutral alpha-glucosidase AB [Condylostylus longicornis]|uniref:neutral alpha-glucosidase AB n=1 Tax=Condylostylus longicornis TaxID=2530218 RepID=UPI00244E5329|nr:neutral alpha-glucosidase AB [Condylostylus longicornis]
MRLHIAFLCSFLAFCLVVAVDHGNFKTCEKSSFCRRLRGVTPGSSPYALVAGSLNTYSDSVVADLINKETNHLFTFKLEAIKSNTFRLLIDEKTPLKPRYKVTDALKGNPLPDVIKAKEQNKGEFVITSGPNKAIIYADPFRIDFYQNDVLTVQANAKGLMRFEELRRKVIPPQVNENEEQGNENGQQEQSQNDANVKDLTNEDPGAWEENFKSHHDSKPNGPEAISMDFSFPQALILFGIPQHADSFALKHTANNGDPYRLYNLDVFEFELDSRMALYGSIPVLYGHGPEKTAGVFWQNSAETWVDIYNSNAEKNVMSSIVNFVSRSKQNDPLSGHFMSESGIIDAFILLGPSPLDAFKQYTDLTGVANLPQLFALAYHQCRWNYNDEQDVETVSAKFDEHDIPMDTMWLDIEYTDGKKYFTWDAHKFPNPLKMIKNLTDLGRHLTIILDPHIKRDAGYFVHNECTDRGYYVKNKDGSDYEGWCWPGSASYPDYFNPEVRKYWADLYQLENFKTVTADVMTWNDMNEPSVFNGPEVTMLKDNVHYGGWEHRNVHNLYGHMNVMGTFEGMHRRDPNQRPFILSRSHFAGTQRYATIWMGDNAAQWGHLEASIKMCLAEAVAGHSFCGADVGGFFGNPDVELLERWYQAAAFQPFFRSHAHIDTKRREPWLFGEATKQIIREAIRKRYSYLPLWYTMFYEHERFGLPVMRPLLAHYPKDVDGFAIDSQHLLQDRLLVRPVMSAGVSKVDVYFPVKENKKPDIWYDIDTYQKYDVSGFVSIEVNSNKIPVFQRGGTIIPKKGRIRRASTLMKNDPYTLVICLDEIQSAKGTLYIDDEKSYKYRDGQYNYIEFEFKQNLITNRFIDKPNYKTKSWLEKIVIAGLKSIPKTATIKSDHKTENLEILIENSAVIIRRPGVSMTENFVITLN